MISFESELEKNISDEIQMYASKVYSSQLISTMLSKETCTSVDVDSMSLFESNITFAHYIFQNPRRALKLLDDAFQRVSLKISKTHALKADMVYKEKLHVRLIALPNLPEVYRSSLPNCSDVGQFLCISGTVVKASTAKILQYKKLWRCSKCKHEFIVEAVVEQGYVCEKPIICKNPDFCNGKNFTLMSTDTNIEYCKDYQEIKLQEQVYNLSIGTVPRSMWVVLEDDLVETCHPGNDVIVSGILIQQWKPLIKGNPTDISLVILAHNIEVQNKMTSGVVSKDMVQEFKQFWHSYKSNPLSGRNLILSSICPQVFGLYIVKLAVALVLAGGIQKKSGSSRIRGDSHLLLVGDPGTAKSQFLKFVTKVSPRSVLTSGIGTTNAGLTVSAVKESGRWELEAGALVLADGGICCIDEFSCIKEQDKTCIHEAMEQQTISVAKAGLVCSLNTRCSILAATNPKSKYDETMTLSENTALGSPLLSRFDIILVLLDTYDENWDDMVASYILDGRNLSNDKNSSLWPVSKIKSYFILIRHINPKMTAQAERLLRSYYTKQRSFQSRNASRTTPRLLQSLIRLAEGHARLMLRTEVLIMDAVIAIILVDSSMLDGSILEGLSPLHTIFPSNPIAEYLEKAEKVFQNLNVEISIEENYECFYEEDYLQSVLHTICVIWTSKDIPYLFGSSSSDDSFNSNMFKNTDISVSKITTNKYNFSESECLYNKPIQVSDISQNSSAVQQFVEVHEKRAVSSTQPQGVNDQVSTLSDLRNIFGGGISETENTHSKNAKNISILSQILETQNEEECIDNDFLPTGTNNTYGTRHFVNPTSDKKASCKKNSNHTNEDNISNKFFTNPDNERSDTDILKELGITQHKESDDMQIDLPISSRELDAVQRNNLENIQTDTSITSGNSSKSLPDNLTSINKNFPFKRSLADQLKSFAFSKFRSTSEQNCSRNVSNSCEINNKAGPSLISNTNNESEKLKSNTYKRKNEIVNQSANKKSAFKMIVDRYKSSQNNIVEKEKFSNTSEISENSQNIINCTQNDTNLVKIEEDKNEYTDVVSENHTIGQSSRKQIPDHLKKFLFSKSKMSKASESCVDKK